MNGLPKDQDGIQATLPSDGLFSVVIALRRLTADFVTANFVWSELIPKPPDTLREASSLLLEYFCTLPVDGHCLLIFDLEHCSSVLRRSHYGAGF